MVPPLNKMAAMPRYGKNMLKNLLLQNQDSFEAESLYIVSETQGYQDCSDDDSKMTFDLFTARSFSSPYRFLITLFSQNSKD